VSKVEEFKRMPWGATGNLVCTGSQGEGVIMADCEAGAVLGPGEAAVIAQHIVKTHNEWLEREGKTCGGYDQDYAVATVDMGNDGWEKVWEEFEEWKRTHQCREKAGDREGLELAVATWERICAEATSQATRDVADETLKELRRKLGRTG
jgi:hypothetical protein